VTGMTLIVIKLYTSPVRLRVQIIRSHPNLRTLPAILAGLMCRVTAIR